MSPLGESVLPRELEQLSVADARELACRSHLGVWTSRKRHLDMAPIHWEWCELAMNERRLALVAPREHSKSETFTVNATAWRCEKFPGMWTYIFAQTGDQAKIMLERTIKAIEETAPWLLLKASITQTSAKLANGCQINTAGAGKSVRGAHPDVIVGDDVLEEAQCRTELQRKRTESWWKGTVGGMAHPGTTRRVQLEPGAPFQTVAFGPTVVHLVGTPFHDQDLLMGMRRNPMYKFYRYAAEFHPDELVPGTMAVEVSK